MFSVVMHAERYRHAGLEANLRDALGRLVAYQLVVARRAADDRAEADDCVILAALRQLLRRQRNLKRARNPYKRDVVCVYAVADQRVLRAGDQLGDDEFVEASANDRKSCPCLLPVLSFEYLH